jgi:transcriptional regulator with XRE-family HTH domain
MKNINNKKINIDPIAEARKGKYFNKYSKEAKERIKLGVEIYNTRENLKISQQELAKKAETTQKVISKIENGDVNVGFSLLNRIADVLGFNHENWGRIFDFNTPYTFLFVGSNTTSHTTKIKENIASLKVSY